MNPIDLCCVIVIGISALAGVVRGLTREILGISAWVGATTVSYYLAPSLASYMDPFITKKSFVTPLSLTVSFIVSLIALSLLSRSLAQMIRFSTLSSLDRTLGLGFGVIRGAILLCLGYIAIGFFISESSHPSLFYESRLRGFLEYGIETLETHFPFLKSFQKPLEKKDGSPTVLERNQKEEDMPNLRETFKSQVEQSFQPSSSASSPSYPGENRSEGSTFDKIVDTLSRLKPQPNPIKEEKKTHYDISQRYNMDRLVHTQNQEER